MATPLPKRQLMILCLSRFADPISFTNIFPYVYFMTKDFGITDDEAKIGYYVGFITASFALCQFLTILFWASLSDRIGRRPVILIGLAGSFFTSLLFGLSRTYAQAIAARALLGLLNGNIGVIRSAVGEITDRTNEARAFTFIPMMWGIGCVIGPLLGGALSNLPKHYPETFGHIQFLCKFPYFPPNGVAALLCLFSWLIAFFFLKETLPTKARRSITSRDQEEELTTGNQEDEISIIDQQEHSERIPLIKRKKNTEWTIKNTITHPLVLMCVTNNFFQSFTSISFDEILPIYAADSPRNGGMGFTESLIGIIMSIMGIFLIMYQLFVFPSMQLRYGSVGTYRLATYFWPIAFICLAIANKHAERIGISPSKDPITFILFGIVLIVRTAAGVLGFTSLALLANNALPRDSGALGKVNGFSQTAGSCARAIGPAVTGALYSLSVGQSRRSLVWVVLITISFVGICVGNFIKDGSYERNELVEDITPILTQDQVKKSTN